MPIYLDHHATTPLARDVRTAMVQWMATGHGNPSSVHSMGRATRTALENAREAIAGGLGTVARELVFTSGGTEAVHLAVRGVAEATVPTRVLCSQGAHPCLRAASELAATAAGAPLTWLPTHADWSGWKAALTEGALVTVSLVQHETGAMMDLHALRIICDAVGAHFVVDAVQAVGKIPVDLGASGAIAAAVSAHKFGGPSGVGVAWVRGDVKVRAVQTGGGQERGLRAGTENVLGAIGLGAAAKALPARLATMAGVAVRRDAIERMLMAEGAVVNGIPGERVPTACHVSFNGIEGQELVAALDLAGICVSSGAACSSGKPEPSESILRMYPDERWRAVGALRVTLGPETTDTEVEDFVGMFPGVLKQVRAG